MQQRHSDMLRITSVVTTVSTVHSEHAAIQFYRSLMHTEVSACCIDISRDVGIGISEVFNQNRT